MVLWSATAMQFMPSSRQRRITASKGIRQSLEKQVWTCKSAFINYPIRLTLYQSSQASAESAFYLLSDYIKFLEVTG